MMNFKLKAHSYHIQVGPLQVLAHKPENYIVLIMQNASSTVAHSELHLPWEVNPDNSEQDWTLHSYLPMSNEINMISKWI